jgi:hypothetical protein
MLPEEAVVCTVLPAPRGPSTRVTYAVVSRAAQMLRRDFHSPDAARQVAFTNNRAISGIARGGALSFNSNTSYANIFDCTFVNNGAATAQVLLPLSLSFSLSQFLLLCQRYCTVFFFLLLRPRTGQQRGLRWHLLGHGQQYLRL